METERKFKWWEYIILKPLRSKPKVDFLTDKDVENVRQLLTNRFASFIEKVQNLDNKPEQAGIIVKAYRNILTSFALALAHPKTDYLAEDGFENLLLLMIEDLSILLGNQKPKFQERVKVLTKNIVKIIYINKSDKNFPPEDPVIFKNLNIGQVRLELLEKPVKQSKEDPYKVKEKAVETTAKLIADNKIPVITDIVDDIEQNDIVDDIEQNDIDEIINNNNDSLTKEQMKEKIRASHGLSVKHSNSDKSLTKEQAKEQFNKSSNETSDRSGVAIPKEVVTRKKKKRKS